MNKLAILTMTFLFVFAVAHGQTQKADKEKETKKDLKTERVALRKLEGTNVNSIAKNNFDADFRDATNVQSKRVDTFDEFVFTDKDGKKMKAYYDFDGKLVGTTQDKTFADLPSKGQQVIKTKYKDYSIISVLFFDDNELNETDMILWATQFDDEDLYFVELTKGSSKIIVKVDPSGLVSFFKKLS